MNQTIFNSQLFSFLRESASPYHAVFQMKQFFDDHGFSQLLDLETLSADPGSSYYHIRDNGSIIACTLGKDEKPEDGFRILAAHTDSPCLQIKPLPDIEQDTYLKLGVEIYGGPLLQTWFDRDLSLAGRTCCLMQDGSLAVFLVDFKRPMLVIPSLAIHFNREANRKNEINAQDDLPPLLAQTITGQLPDLKTLLLEQLKQEYPQEKIGSILTFDLSCYDTQPPVFTGHKKEFICGGKLDNLLSCFVGMQSIGAGKMRKNCLLLCTNHEENGSVSVAGAGSNFAESFFKRIIPDPAMRLKALEKSFLISIDNSHATHPNFTSKSDKAHKIFLNMAPVIKINANQRYATSSISAAIYKKICNEVEVNPQEFVMRSDMACGSTIGPMTAARLGIKTVDVGIPTLAMHSIREFTGAADPFLLYRTTSGFMQMDMNGLVVRQ
ncbi:M18 family aminopeptidase [Desulfomarina sp.]